MTDDRTPLPGDPITDYIRDHRNAFTRPALREALIQAGHDPAHVDAALDAEGVARSTVEPPSIVEPPFGYAARHPRLVTAAILTAAYVAMWLLFALVTDWNASYAAPLTTVILAAVLGVLGLISLAYVAATKRLTSGGRAAIVGVLTVPIILLLVIGGLCVPFTPFRWR
jgi:hypothetical protein